jgi:DNA (cytosine-5)-methyltransferase 1
MKSPTSQQIRKARERAGLSRKDAADLIYKSVRTWEKWENGERTMDPAFWELWQRKLTEKNSD